MHKWFKGNTHIHSTASDGGKTFRDIARRYAAKGYSFLVRTDHWVASDCQADGGKAPLLWLDGVELDGPDTAGAQYHVVCIGTFQGIRREMGLVAAMEACQSQGGWTVLAHPFWMGNSEDDVRRWSFDAVEVYNHVCQWLNGKGNGLVHWHQMLARQPGMLAVASDDAHIKPEHPGWNGGWIMVNAPECTREAILQALRAGDYYSSNGPSFEAIDCAPGRVAVRTSPVRFIRLVGPASQGRRTGAFRGPPMTEAAFEIPQAWPYAYVEIEDGRGRRAWTNPVKP
jgi:hypothetical protein